MRFLTLNTHSWCEIHQIAKSAPSQSSSLNSRWMSLRCRKSTSSPPPPVVKEPLNYRGGAGVPVHEDNYALLLVQALNEMGATYEWTLTEATSVGTATTNA